jgi:hypothetical protein
MVVSQDEQCNFATVNSDWQIGQRVGAGRMVWFLQFYNATGSGMVSNHRF